MPEPSPRRRARASRWRTVVLLIGVVASICLAVAGLAMLQSPDTFGALDFVAATAAGLSLVLSGAVLATRLPAHPVGWLLWAGGCLFAIASGTEGLARVVVSSNASAAAWILLAGVVSWVPAIACVAILLPLVFPTGHLPSRRWRLVVAVGVVSVLFSVIQSALTPFSGSSVAGIPNPLQATGAAADVATALGNISSLSGVICLPLVASSLVLRFRQASGVERAQLKWLAAAVGLAGPALAVAITARAIPGELASIVGDVAFLATFVGLTLLPVAIGVAVLRYRLYEIDLIIRRTAVYIPLTAVLAGLYAASTALLQRVFIAATGARSDGAVVVTTLILATLFTPIKGWLQGIVDRRFRDEIEAERQFERFIDRVARAEWTPDPARTLRAFLSLAIRAVGAAGGRAMIDDGSGSTVVASVSRSGPVALVARVESPTRRIGQIELGAPAHGDAYRPADIALVQESARRLAEAIIDGVVAPRAIDPAPAMAPTEPMEVGPEQSRG